MLEFIEKLKERVIPGSKLAVLVSPPFYRLLGTHNNRIVLSLQTLASVMEESGVHAVVVNLDYQDSLEYGDRETMFRNQWAFDFFLENGHKSFDDWNDLVRFFSETYEVVAYWYGCGDILIPTVPVNMVDTAMKCVRIQKKWSKVKSVAYGQQVTVSPIEFTNGFDCVVAGEAESVWEKVHNLSVKIVYGRPLVSKELNKLPFIGKDYSFVPLESMDMEYVLGARGCNKRCKFCYQSVLDSGIRAMSAKRFVDELEWRKKKLEVELHYVCDMIFTWNKMRVFEICEDIISRDLNIQWYCESRVDTVDHEMLRIMKSAGCNSIKYGADGVTDRLNGLMQKEITKEQIDNAFFMTKDAGIKIGCYLLLGVEGASESDYLDQYRQAKELKADYYVLSVNNDLANRIGKERGHMSSEMISKWGITENIMKSFFDLAEFTVKKDPLPGQKRRYVRRLFNKNNPYEIEVNE